MSEANGVYCIFGELQLRLRFAIDDVLKLFLSNMFSFQLDHDIKKKKKKKKEQFNCDSYRIFLGFVLKEEGERRRRRRGERRRRRSKGRKPKDFLVESKQNIEGQADQSS